MSLKDKWLERLDEHEGDTITIKEISACTSDGKKNAVTYLQIWRDIEKKALRATQRAERCAIIIEKKDAKDYLLSFEDSQEDLTPPTKPLFPDFFNNN